MLRRVVTVNSLYSEAEDISDYVYATDEDELTICYAEELYDKVVQVDFEDFPLCPLASIDFSIYSEIRPTGADNIQPAAMDPVHPNDKSIQTDIQVREQSAQVVQEEMVPLVNNAEQLRPADLPENIIIHVPEELSDPTSPSTSTPSSTLTARFVGANRIILNTDQLLLIATACTLTALGILLIVGIGLIAKFY